jgi:hypothetical protein
MGSPLHGGANQAGTLKYRKKLIITVVILKLIYLLKIKWSFRLWDSDMSLQNFVHVLRKLQKSLETLGVEDPIFRNC